MKLKKAFPGTTSQLYKPDALGKSFFETPLQAIKCFLAARRLDIDSIERRRKEVERAIEWATNQAGMQ